MNRYGSMFRKKEETGTPAPCRRNCPASTPPNRYAPSAARAGFHPAKITSATAIQPRPAVMFSVQPGFVPSEIAAPPKPASAPPAIT